MDRRATFRFRLPWQQQQPGVAPAPRPRDETQSPSPAQRQPTSATTTTPAAVSQPTSATTAPAQRSSQQPSRPPGSASAQPIPPPATQSRASQPASPSRTAPPPQSQSRLNPRQQRAAAQPSSTSPQPRAAAKPSSPSRAAAKPSSSPSRVTAQPSSSPSRAAAAKPSSPSRAAAKPSSSPSRAVDKPSSSPSRVTAAKPSSSPSRAAAAKPSSPSRTAAKPSSPSRTAAQPSSPSRAADSQPATQPPSPTHLASQSSSPSSPNRHAADEVQPTAASTIPQPESPIRYLQPITDLENPQPPSSVSPQEPTPTATQQQTHTPPSISPPEPTPTAPQPQSHVPPQEQTIAVPQLQSHVPEPKSEIISETHENNHQNQTTFLPNGNATTILSHEKPEENQKDNVVQELVKEKETNGGSANEQPKKGIVLSDALESITPPTFKQPTVTWKAEDMQQEKHEHLGTKRRLPTSEPMEIHNRPTFPHPQDKNTVREESHKKPYAPEPDRAPMQREIRDDISKLVHKMTTGQPKHSVDGKPVTVITLAGDNKGASMHLGQTNGESPIPIHRGYKINSYESPELTTDGEGNSKARNPHDSRTKEDRPKTFINSNIQSINNSLMFNGSITERDPGVHLVLSHNQTESKNSDGKTQSLETRKAEINITPSEKLTYEPTVRRRCLRGLLMESSDSEPDDPDKPRRHGCRYSCSETTKENIDVL